MAMTRTRFKEWLDTMPPDAVAGQRKLETCCPLARFLKWDSPGGYVWVGIGNYRIGADFVGALPNWAYVLRKAVDTDERYFNRDTVTVGEVRRLLAGIEDEAFMCEIDP